MSEVRWTPRVSDSTHRRYFRIARLIYYIDNNEIGISCNGRVESAWFYPNIDRASSALIVHQICSKLI